LLAAAAGAAMCCQASASPPYRDLEVVQELANMLRGANRVALTAPLVADESKKWLEWPEYLGLVAALRKECAGAGHSTCMPGTSSLTCTWSCSDPLCVCVCVCVCV
jgi:hypothetical protein